jgi:hypothetical protein
MATFGDVTITVQELVAVLTAAWSLGNGDGFQVGLKIGKGENAEAKSPTKDVDRLIADLIRGQP